MKNAFAMSAALSAATMLPAAAHSAQKLKNFGPWSVLADKGHDTVANTAWVELVQVQNEDDGGIGDTVTATWQADKQAIALSFEIRNCTGPDATFERYSSISQEEWLPKGDRVATADFRARMAGWIKEATAACSARKAATIFKMPKLNAAMAHFRLKALEYQAFEKGRAK